MNAVPDLTTYDVIVINTSGGKDSQAMFDYVMELAVTAGVQDRVLAVHCDLGKVEWNGTLEMAQTHSEHYGVPFHVVRREKGNLLQLILERGMWPSSTNRYCTSYMKRDQVPKLITAIVRQLDLGRAARVLNCMGLRAEESPARAKKPAFEVDKRQTNGKRKVDNWLPLHGWTTSDVWNRIKASGVPHHYAYDLGMPRLSCVFCIFASPDALMIAGEHNPELLDEYVALEEKMGHTFRNGFKIGSIKERLAAGERCTTATNWKA